MLEEPDDDDPSITRIRAVVLAMVVDAKRHTRESPSAGRTLLETYGGRPPVAAERVRPPAAGTVADASSTLDLLLAVCRDRLLSGELAEGDVAPLLSLLLASEKAEADMIAKILGDKTGGLRVLKDRAEAILAKYSARTIEAAPTPETQQPAPDGESAA